MPETTSTQRSAHLIQGNSSASRPGAHMPAEQLPVTMEESAWDWIVDMGRAAGETALWAVGLVIAVAVLAAAAGAIYTFLTN